MKHLTKFALALISFFVATTAQAQQGMGVGNNNPLEMLDVSGAVKVGTDINNSNAAPTGGAGTIRFKAGVFQGWDGTSWIPLGGGADSDWTISGNNQYSAVSGNVGIGTASPAAKLDINGDARMAELRSYGFTTGTNVILLQGATNSDQWMRFRKGGGAPNGNAGVIFSSFNNDHFFLNNTGQALTISSSSENAATPGFSNATERMRLSSTGNLGIGTAIPSDKLHVAGSIRMVDGNQAAGYIPVSDANGKMTWTDPASIITAADGDGSSTNELQTLSQTGTNVTLSNGGGTISVADNDNSTTNELQTLSISGNDITLSNGGGTVSVLGLADNLGNHTATQNIETNGNWMSGDGGNEGVFVDDNGDVGIGTNSPNYELQINDDINPNSYVHFTHAATGTTTNDGLLIGLDDNNDGRISLHENRNLLFATNDMTRMTLTEVGEVGIMTTAPTERLHINSNASQTFLKLTTSNTGQTSSDGLKIGVSLSRDAIIDHLENQDILFATQGTERMRIKNGGKIGIGVDLPVSLFHVRDDFAVANEFVATIHNMGDGAYSNGLEIQAGQNTQSVNNRFISFQTPNGTEIGAVRQVTSASVDYNTTSDERLKTNIQPTTKGLNDLMQIEVKDYVYKEDMNKPQTGFIAQQVYAHYPNAVSVGGDDAKTDPWMMDYGKMSPLLVKAIQDQQEIIEMLLKRIEELEKSQR